MQTTGVRAETALEYSEANFKQKLRDMNVALYWNLVQIAIAGAFGLGLRTCSLPVYNHRDIVDQICVELTNFGYTFELVFDSRDGDCHFLKINW